MAWKEEKWPNLTNLLNSLAQTINVCYDIPDLIHRKMKKGISLALNVEAKQLD